MPRKLTLREVNSLNSHDFVGAFGSLFEHSPWIAEQAWSSRPFQALGDLQHALDAVVLQAPQEQQLALIRAHPELGARAAIQGTLTPESASEQTSVGLHQLPDQERDSLLDLNRTYRETFGFPFVVCVREHTRESLTANARSRLQHARGEEIQTALTEICKIAHLRLADLVEMDDARWSEKP